MTTYMERIFHPERTTAPFMPPNQSVNPERVIERVIERELDPRLIPQRLYMASVDCGVHVCRAVDIHYLTLCDMHLANLQGMLVLYAVNTMDMDIEVQAIGSEYLQPSNDMQVYEIDAWLPVPAKDQATINVDLSKSWFPWMGLRMRMSMIANEGALTVRARYQRWTD